MSQEQPSQYPPNYQPQYNPPPYPQQPYYQPPPPPQRKSHKGLWITLAIIAAFLLFSCIGVTIAATNSAKNTVNTLSTAVATTDTTTTTQATSAPAQSFKPITITGNGNKKTAVFNAPGTWSIAYSCYGFTDGVDGAFTVSVYSADGTILDAGAINATCKANSKSSDSTIEHQGGSVYLDINATGNWTITVKAA